MSDLDPIRAERDGRRKAEEKVKGTSIGTLLIILLLGALIYFIAKPGEQEDPYVLDPRDAKARAQEQVYGAE